MKKIMIISCACLLAFTLANIGVADEFADEEENWILGRHAKWLEKVMVSDRYNNKATNNKEIPGGITVFKGAGGEKHTIALTFWNNEGPSGNVLSIGDFVLELQKVYYHDEQIPLNEWNDIYIYTFEGDPEEVGDAIASKYWTDNTANGVSTGELYGQIVLGLISEGDLDYILERYDDVSFAKYISGFRDQVILNTNDPARAAEIMSELIQEDLVKWAEFNSHAEIIYWGIPFEPPAYEELDEVLQRKNIEEEALKKASDPLFSGQMAGGQKEVIPLQKER